MVSTMKNLIAKTAVVRSLLHSRQTHERHRTKLLDLRNFIVKLLGSEDIEDTLKKSKVKLDIKVENYHFKEFKTLESDYELMFDSYADWSPIIDILNAAVDKNTDAIYQINTELNSLNYDEYFIAKTEKNINNF